MRGHHSSVLRLVALVGPGGTILASADVWDVTTDAFMRPARCTHERWAQPPSLWTDGVAALA